MTLYISVHRTSTYLLRADFYLEIHIIFKTLYFLTKVCMFKFYINYDYNICGQQNQEVLSRLLDDDLPNYTLYHYDWQDLMLYIPVT